MEPGSRVKRKRGTDDRTGTIIEIDNWDCAKVKWDTPTVNSFTGAVIHHSTVALKNLIDINFVAPEPAIEQKGFDLFNQK